MSFIFKSLAKMESAFICVHPRPNRFFLLTEKRLKDNLLNCGDRIHGVAGGLGTVETSNVSLLYSDEKYEVWIDNEKDNITLSMADRGITILFTRDEWQEFQEVIANIMLEEEEEAEET